MSQLVPGSAAEKKVLLLASLLAGGLVISDQVTKFLIKSNLQLGQKISIIPKLFNLTFITNKGAAWGMMSGYGHILLMISVVVFIALIFFIRSLSEGWRERYFALTMIMSGIVGNSIDRLWHKAVIDFLDFYIGHHHWPSFNVADSAITVGVGIFIISSFFRPQAKADGETEDAKEEPTPAQS